MTATNHALTGVAIAIIIGQPEIAIPFAFMSHFICDAMPHFGAAVERTKLFRSKIFKIYLLSEAFLCFIIELSLVVFQPTHWVLAGICAFVAASPDLLSINRFAAANKHKKYSPWLYVKFATKIQWFERPIGAVVEIAWLAAMIAIILPFYINA